MSEARERREALADFDRLLRADAPERDFQRLFTRYPAVLSTGLPLRLSEREVRPLGRPGRAEADFALLPEGPHPSFRYGIVELKRPRTRLVTQPRRDVFILSADARTAISQAEKYGDKLGPTLAVPPDALLLGARRHLFVILGMARYWAGGETPTSVLDRLFSDLPRDCELLGYDELRNRFAASVEPRMSLLVVAPKAGELQDREREILAFERRHWKYPSARAQAISDLFEMTPDEYSSVLAGLLDRPEAYIADPMLVARLIRLRAFPPSA